jgi:hypothetical protein
VSFVAIDGLGKGNVPSFLYSLHVGLAAIDHDDLVEFYGSPYSPDAPHFQQTIGFGHRTTITSIGCPSASG